ncbi:MAG TPA: hypothetical protein VES40_08240, partial [Ilumatobacteraceae bacterium]|nr:hypothetical protein [Ilumatobacteraceae bacterium]
MTVPQLLLDLQTIDTSADQLAHRRTKSSLRDDFTEATKQATSWERARAVLEAQIAALGESIDAAETRSAELLTNRQRFDQQLRTVIAPREAEALMH